jgi:hypothetical protein
MSKLRKLATVFLSVAAMLIAVACSVDPGPAMVQSFAAPTAPEAGLPAWLSVENAENCLEGCWRVDSVIFEDWHESGGNHHLYVQTRNQDGVWIRDQPFHLAYPDGDDRSLSKLPPDWGNIPVWACFSPDAGEVGPYWAYGGDDVRRSDIVRGIGLPECQHVNVKIVFRYQEQFPAPPCELVECRQLYLPIIQHTP